LKVGVICDLAEERWPSMDVVAEMLLERLPLVAQTCRPANGVQAVRLQAPYRRRASALPLLGRLPAAFTLDRFANRLVDYPRWLREKRDGFDIFHLADHSYSHLVHVLPADQTVVTCHDLDTFRSVLEPRAEPRSAAFRAMTRRILDGFRRAARVTCDSAAIRDEILAHELIPPDKLHVVPNGVHPDFSAAPNHAADAQAAVLLGPWRAGMAEVLHVGSTIPRKGIDTLLRVFAGVRRRHPAARLIRIGGPFSPSQRRLASVLGVADAVVELPFLPRPVVSAVYRRSQIVLLPSLREGFGLPIVEAMAAGAVVVASDLRALREVGGDAAVYCPQADVDRWVQTVGTLIDEHDRMPEGWGARRQAGLARASRFSWDDYARRMLEIYRTLGSSPVVTIQKEA
jgi:glycosyltransferase involved in cell wall biosynthesis